MSAGDQCPRTFGGFCRIAELGHRLCPIGGRCRVVDHAKAAEEAHEAAVRRFGREMRERSPFFREAEG